MHSDSSSTSRSGSQLRAEPLLQSPYEVHYETPLQMRMSDSPGGGSSASSSNNTQRESLILNIDVSSINDDRSSEPGGGSSASGWRGAVTKAGRTLFVNLCLCRWPRRSFESMDVTKWRAANHQYQRAPPNTTLQEFLDQSNRELQPDGGAEAVVTVLPEPDSSNRLSKHALFSDEPTNAVQAGLEDGDDDYFHDDEDEEVIARPSLEAAGLPQSRVFNMQRERQDSVELEEPTQEEGPHEDSRKAEKQQMLKGRPDSAGLTNGGLQQAPLMAASRKTKKSGKSVAAREIRIEEHAVVETGT
ncbi:unnamed protein product [Amoebophrya sp. A120]|nr:unnamed protein product [Amoebophrya sp. A120]|eukprot:GSA120T00010412001.1